MVNNFNKLDTKNFSNTIGEYNKYITRFNEIVAGVNSITGAVVSNWAGKGKNAFEKDCLVVQRNLKDVGDIMTDMRDYLSAAYADYVKTDNSVSKK